MYCNNQTMCNLESSKELKPNTTMKIDRTDYIAAKNKFVANPERLDLHELLFLQIGTEEEIAKGDDGTWHTAGLIPTLNTRLKAIVARIETLQTQPA